jgi:hypothetical protein
MPYLNWTRTSLRPVASAHPTRETELTLVLTDELWLELRERIGPILAGSEAGELRLDLPGGWTLFWKRREGESRLLMAHPEHEEWVATLALGSDHAERVLSAFGTETRLRVGELGEVAGLCNFELALERRSG